MGWPEAIFSAAVALFAAALIKYGFTWLIIRSQKQTINQAIYANIRTHMREEIIKRIDDATRETIIQAMYGELFEVRDKEGHVIGQIGRTDTFQKAGGTDHKVTTADR
jgi:hypothetical protein